MTTKKELLAELDALKVLAEEQTRMFMRSRDYLYEALAKLYLWWRRADSVKGFLDDLYKKHELITKPQDGQENYTRLLRMVWCMDWGTPSAANLQQWSRVLKIINHEYTTRLDFYKTNDVNKIINFIHSSGGIRALLLSLNENENEDDGNDDSANKRKKKRKSTLANVDELSQQKIEKKHLQEAEVYYAQPTTKAINSIQPRKPVVVNHKGYALALVKKRSNGKIDILNYVNDDSIVRQVLIGSYKRNNEAAPMSVRLLTEIVSTQALPIELENYRKQLTPVSKIKVDGESRRQIKRVLFRVKKKNILFSENRTSCSVVVVVKPNSYPILSREDVFLNANDKRYIEKAIIQARDLSFYTANDKAKIPQVKTGQAYSHSLVLKNTVTEKIRSMHFYKFDLTKETPIHQADIASSIEKPTWTASVAIEWLLHLNAEFLSAWLTDYGSQITRPIHKTMALAFTKTALQFKHYGENGNFSDTESKLTLDGVRNTAKPITAMFKTRDIIPILHSLVHADIVGKIEIGVHSTYLYIVYKTQIATYSVYVPTCQKNGKYIEDAFTSYES